jgi:hypothetical protein
MMQAIFRKTVFIIRKSNFLKYKVTPIFSYFCTHWPTITNQISKFGDVNQIHFILTFDHSNFILQEGYLLHEKNPMDLFTFLSLYGLILHENFYILTGQSVLKYSWVSRYQFPGILHLSLLKLFLNKSGWTDFVHLSFKQ